MYRGIFKLKNWGKRSGKRRRRIARCCHREAPPYELVSYGGEDYSQSKSLHAPVLVSVSAGAPHSMRRISRRRCYGKRRIIRP